MASIAGRVLKRGRRLAKQITDAISILPPNTSIHSVKKALKPVLGLYAIQIQIRKNQVTDAHQVITIGECQFDSPTPSIVMTLLYSNREIWLTDQYRKKLVGEITSSVVHELTHREQLKMNKGKGIQEYDEASYLRQHHELSAFANDISMELWMHGHPGVMISYSDMPTYLKLYFDEFGFESKHLRNLLKKISLNIDLLNQWGEYKPNTNRRIAPI